MMPKAIIARIGYFSMSSANFLSSHAPHPMTTNHTIGGMMSFAKFFMNLNILKTIFFMIVSFLKLPGSHE